MPPFRFSLEQVLNYRIQLEQQAKVELARVEQERLREQQRADTLRAMLDEQERADLSVTVQRVRNWTMAAEAARTELISRSKDKKTLEKLKATQAENHAREEQLREQHEYDETASLRYKASY